MKKIITTIGLIFVFVIGINSSNHAQLAQHDQIYPPTITANLTLSIPQIVFLDINVFLERFDGEKWNVKDQQHLAITCVNGYVNADQFIFTNFVPDGSYRIRVVIKMTYRDFSQKEHVEITESAEIAPEISLNFNIFYHV